MTDDIKVYHVPGDNITYRSDNYSDLHSIIHNSLRIVYQKLRDEQLIASWYRKDVSAALIEKTNFLYVLIVDWKEFWQDV